VIRNLRVLATDQRTDNATDENGNAIVKTFSTVTVEATPKIAEEIAVAQTVGELSLSLRSLADNKSQLEEAIASGAVDVPEGTDPKAEQDMLLRIASQPVSGDTTYSTGADVSRFQRSTVPGKAETGPMGAAGGIPVGKAVIEGPVVRVARGNAVTEVPVGGKN
jgi:pilus assembly protein CpaB